jgi:ligand-binding SRPBCC domain-containing protein
MRTGVVYRIQVRQFGIIPVTMQSLIRDYTPPNSFVDVQVPGKGPFKSWEHQHRFTALSPDCTRLTDHITYEMPFGLFGALADRLFVRRDIAKMFAYRHKVTRREVEGE